MNSELSKIKIAVVHHGAETAQKVDRRKWKVDRFKKEIGCPDLPTYYSPKTTVAASARLRVKQPSHPLKHK